MEDGVVHRPEGFVVLEQVDRLDGDGRSAGTGMQRTRDLRIAGLVERKMLEHEPELAGELLSPLLEHGDVEGLASRAQEVGEDHYRVLRVGWPPHGIVRMNRNLHPGLGENTFVVQPGVLIVILPAGEVLLRVTLAELSLVDEPSEAGRYAREQYSAADEATGRKRQGGGGTGFGRWNH